MAWRPNKNNQEKRPGQPSWNLDPAVKELLEPKNRDRLGRAPIVIEAERVASAAFRNWVELATYDFPDGRREGLINSDSPWARMKDDERAAIIKSANIAIEKSFANVSELDG